MLERRMFIDEQASLDLAIGCLAEGHTWEALQAAIVRAMDSVLVPVELPPVKHGGLTLS